MHNRGVGACIEYDYSGAGGNQYNGLSLFRVYVAADSSGYLWCHNLQRRVYFKENEYSATHLGSATTLAHKKIPVTSHQLDPRIVVQRHSDT